MRSMTFAAVVLMAAIGAEISQPALAGAGELDPTFGISGRAVLPAGPTTNGYAYANALLVQPDARIVMAGYNYPDGSSVYRLMPNGDLDVTFGAGGRRDPGINGVFGLVLQPDGKFVVGGSAYAGSAEGFGLVRLSADGTVDTSFGSNGTGIVSSAFGSGGAYARKLLLQSDGKVIAIGFTNAGSSATFNAIALARYLPDGSLDTTFGAGGQQTYNVDSGTYIYPNDAALQSDGKIVIVGSRSGTVYSPVLLRYTNAGQIDPGLSTTAPGTLGFSILNGVFVQDDGKFVLAGGGASAHDGRQARLNADGTPDSAYGTAGVTVIPPSGEISNRGLILQPDGKVLSLWDNGFEGLLPRIVRLTTAGALDASFGGGGIAAVPMANPTYPRSLALQPDGKILVAGQVSIGSGGGTDFVAHYGLLRYQGDEIAGTIVEFFNTILGHYFITASAAEQASIDAGGSGPGWIRTGYNFSSGGVSRACRFYGTPGMGPNSHFYTIDPAECAAVKTDPGWHFESYDFSATPPGAGNSCAGDAVPVYRAYNQRFPQNDSNHRYTTNLAVYSAQVAAGWAGEGVVFCAPP